MSTGTRILGAYFTVPRVMLDTSVMEDELPQTRVSSRSPFDKKFDGICKQCNNGWLRDFEEMAKSEVVPFAPV